jgi:hypothetical protein
MTSVDETIPEDKEKEPINNEVETNEEIQIESTEQTPIEQTPIEQTPTEFCEEIKEKTAERVQKLFECPKCHKMLTNKTLQYYHECTKNDVPKAKRRPKKIVVENIEPSSEHDPPQMPVKLTRQTNQTVDIEDIEDIKYPIQKSYEELRTERLQQDILQRHDKIQQLFKSAI